MFSSLLHSSPIHSKICSAINIKSLFFRNLSNFGPKQDLVVIGGGPGGYVAAIRAAQQGMKVTCVEKEKLLGGTCLNVGCIPSKALLHASHLFELTKKEMGVFGIENSNNPFSMNMTKLQQYKQGVVQAGGMGIESLFKKNGVKRIQGTAKIISPKQVAIQIDNKKKTLIESDRILIATGSEPSTIPNTSIKFDEKHILSSTGVLSLSYIPSSMVIVGGGVIGLELGSVFNRLGTKVTVIEYFNRICPTMDIETSKILLMNLKKQGMKFLLSHSVKSANIVDNSVEIIIENNNKSADTKTKKKDEIQSNVVLISTGRIPVTHTLGNLDELGIELTKNRFIKINENYETTSPGIFAIGDVVPGPMLAHKAEEEGLHCIERILGNDITFDYNTIPGVVYTQPEVASVGMTEENLVEQNIDYVTGKFPFRANGRARCNNDTVGQVKVLADKDSNKLLGMHIIGSDASELIAEGVLALRLNKTAKDVAHTCHAHPTLSESVKEACLSTFSKAINL